MAVNKIYQDNVIAGGSIRDGQGKRIDTTYAKKSDIPDAYTKTEVNNLLVDKADVEDIPISTSQLTNDSGFVKATDIEPILLTNEDLNTFKVNNKSYYALENTCTNTPTSDAQYGFFLQVYLTGEDPTGRSGYNQVYTQICTMSGGNIYKRTLYIDFNSLQPVWTTWSKLATTNDIPLDTEKLTMSYADETLTFSYPDTSYGVVTFDLTPTNGTLEVTTPAIKKATNMYKVVKNRDITYSYTAQGYKSKSGTVNVTDDITITVVLEAGAGDGGDTGAY